MELKKLFFILIALSIGIVSCKKEKAEEQTIQNSNTAASCDSISPNYTDNISAIMSTRCSFSGCHNSGTAANGIVLETYEQVSAEAAKDRFLGSIKGQAPYTQMPLGGSLNENDIQEIECWISQGFAQ